MKNLIKNKKGLGRIMAASVVAVLLVGAFTYYFFYIKPSNEQGAKCLSVSDCDDGNACTVDRCSSFSGICYHPQKICARGEFCNLDNGMCELIKKTTQEIVQNTSGLVGNQTQNITQSNATQSEGAIELSTMNQIENAIDNALAQ